MPGLRLSDPGSVPSPPRRSKDGRGVILPRAITCVLESVGRSFDGTQTGGKPRIHHLNHHLRHHLRDEYRNDPLDGGMQFALLPSLQLQLLAMKPEVALSPSRLEGPARSKRESLQVLSIAEYSPQVVFALLVLEIGPRISMLPEAGNLASIVCVPFPQLFEKALAISHEFCDHTIAVEPAPQPPNWSRPSGSHGIFFP